MAFDGVVLRDSMVNARFIMEQMGGMLDRLYRGEPGSCPDFEDYYGQLVGTATYHSVPADWQGVYNDYVWAVENGIGTNENIYLLCDEGGGILTKLNYDVARVGINDSLSRLGPAIDMANALLGQ